MKILTVALVCLPFLSYSQTQIQENKTNIQIGNKNNYEIVAEQKKAEGLTYIGSGEYLITEVGGSGFIGVTSLKKKSY